MSYQASFLSSFFLSFFRCIRGRGVDAANATAEGIAQAEGCFRHKTVPGTSREGPGTAAVRQNPVQEIEERRP